MTQPTVRQTKDDKKITAALAIRRVAESLTELGLEGKSTDELRAFLKSSSKQLMLHVKVLDPIPSLNYVHKINKRNQPSTPVLEDVTNKRPRSDPPPEVTIELPSPKSGPTFSKRELIEVLLKTSKGTKLRTATIKKIIESKLIPTKSFATSQRFIQKLMKKHEEEGASLESLDTPWARQGRQPMLNETAVSSIVSKLRATPGLTLDNKTMKTAISEQRQGMLLERGIEPLNDCSPRSPNTVTNYQALVACQPNVSVTRTSLVKSNNRFIAENSLRCSMAFITTAAATHFIQVSRQVPDVQKLIMDRKSTSEWSKFLHDEVEKVMGHVLPVRPCYVTSSDDSVEFVFKGADEKHSKSHFMLVASKALGNAGTRSKFSVGSADHKSGLRVKISHTFAGNGAMAPLFVSVCGLTEAELPKSQCPSGVLKLEVEGLGITGGVGTVVFIWNDNDKETDKVRYRIYRDTILVPFIRKQRMENDGWVEGTPILDSMTAVSWSDGDVPQVTVIQEEETQELFKNEKIISNKQNASRSATEQAADLGKAFKEEHAVLAATTAENIDESNHPMKRAVTLGFEKMKDQGLNLSLTKRQALIDFLSVINEALGKAATRANIVHGFESNGLVPDSKKFKTKFAFPDFKLMLGTIRRDITTEEFEMCKSAFAELFKIQLEQGHIPESEFDRLGFPVDKNSSGEEIPKTASITQEWCQRAKCLTHLFVKMLRLKKQQKIDAEVDRKVAEKVNKWDDLVKTNQECEALLKDKEITLESLHDRSILVKHLNAFVHVRTCTGTTIPPKDDERRWSTTRGSVQEAKDGKDTLLARAFKLKDSPVIIERPVKPAPKSPQASTRHQEATVVSVSPKLTRFSSEEKASTFLKDDQWRLRVLIALDPFHTCPTFELNDDAIKRADTLQKQLEVRLQTHCETRITKNSNRDHWCLKWAAKNLPQVSAIMVMFDHVKLDLSCLDHNQCLLKSEASFRAVKGPGAHGGLEGAYIQFDKNNMEWIRSGKTVGTTFWGRNGKHLIGSLLRTVADKRSAFYNAYASRTVELADNGSRKGVMENVQMFVAIGFNKMKCGDVLKDFSTRRGIFHFDKETNKKIDAANIPGASRLQSKQQHMLGYLWELGYDLCLAPESNISGSPGFEAVMNER